MNEKICPILLLALYLSVGGGPGRLCMQDKCAWWNEHLGCCGLIAQGLLQGIQVVRREGREDQDH